MSTVEIPLMSREEDAREAKPAPEDSKLKAKLKLKGLQAWRFTVASGALAGILILLVNIITLGVVYGQSELVNNSLALSPGSCARARGASLGAHVIINILSTILLAYSNFSMQCLSSPTRKEIDMAHSKRHWLHIGVPSIRNVFFVSRKKAALWIILGVSSFPLHMIWNSTVFETKASYDYIAATVTEDFFNGGSIEIPLRQSASDGKHDEYSESDYMDVLSALQKQAMNNKLEKLTVEDCISKYKTNMLSDRRHVLLVPDSSSKRDHFHHIRSKPRNTVLTVYNNANPLRNPALGPLYQWMCDEGPSEYGDKDCRISARNKLTPGSQGSNAGMFGIAKVSIQTCYSQSEEEQCKIEIVPVFMFVIIACNVIKILAFIGALYLTKQDTPLCTTGDAIQSFIKTPDRYTRGRCLAAKEDYEKLLTDSREWDPRPPGVGDIWTGGRYLWRKSSHDWHWAIYIVITSGLLAAFVAIATTALTDGGSIGTSVKQIIGDPRSQDIVWNNLSISVLTGFLLANLPQMLVSYIYLALNNLLTCMLAMAEWCSYATKSGSPVKGLRVSSPQPSTAQRSTYFLSLPYRWAVPTTAIVALLHWLVSQMFFFARVDVYGITTEPPGESFPVERVYISYIAVVVVICLGYFMLFILMSISVWRRYPDNMPLSGCCSASIAASCHPSRVYDDHDDQEDDDDDASNREIDANADSIASQKLCWGVVEPPNPAINGNVGHATFSATETIPLVRDKLYA
ncbi:hypothetical protein N7456_000577 [Penicillium angulare]|uniref:DUF6536 domain-containing protein n=1 Tax=Penicillium angulare TaxID=116970 RepID=A0A9W9GCE9_9EURO|nr:hypothetical protein N7456_000577 [Penicillium angulare]